MYDILLISPMPVPGQEPVIDAYDPADYVNVSTALAYLGAPVRNENFSIKIFDSTLELFPKYKWKYLTERLSKIESKIYGINVHATCVYPQSLRIAGFLKKKFPESIIILGGLPITYLYNYAFRDSKNIDIIVLGEGEETIIELMNSIIYNKLPLKSIPGIIFRNGKRLLKTKNRPLIYPLDKILPPAWDLFDISKIKKLCKAGLGLSASRGCVGNCAFCSDKNFWQNRIRYHSPDRFISDIKRILALGINKFQLTDDNFALNRSFVINVCKKIISEGLKIEWFANCRADCIDEEMISLMKNAGCNRILIGIESGCNKILSGVNKKENTRIIQKSINILRKYGVESIGTCIVGLPGENYETFSETIQFVSSLKLSSLCFYPFIPFPGCDIWNNPRKYGIEIKNYKFEEYIEPYVIISTKELSSEQIKTLLFFARHYALRVSTKLNSYADESKILNIKDKYFLDKRKKNKNGGSFIGKN